ncbi:MAG: hypothetical protein AAGD38_07845 [Acidobacteriota bacterium]
MRTIRRTFLLAWMCFFALSVTATHAATVGYYDMVLEQGNPDQEDPITTAGDTPMNITALSAAELAMIDVLFVQNPSNGVYGSEYLAQLSVIEDAVANGMVLVIHDRFVSDAQTILPGGGAFNTVRDLNLPGREDIQVRDTSTLVTSGSNNRTIDDTTLDNGNFSCHGYVRDDANLPASTVKILTRGNPADQATADTELVTMAYVFGSGWVIYSTIPLDQNLGGMGANAAFATTYAPNVIEYASVLSIRAPDLEVTKTDGVSTAVAGEPITYTITVLNKGTEDAVGAMVMDNFPIDLDGVTWTCAPTGGASCTNPSGSGNINESVTLPAGDSVIFTANGTIASSASGTLSNTAEASHPSDPFPSNNAATDTTDLTASADLALIKTGPAMAASGGMLVYTLEVTNLGPSDAAAVVLDDPTPAGLSFVSATDPCTGGFPCMLGTVTAGTTETITVTFDVPSPYLGPDPIVNLATVSSATADPLSANNVGRTATAVDRQPSADLALTVSGPPSAALGSKVKFRLVLTNHGPDDASDVMLIGPPPTGLLFESATAPCTSGLPCDLVSLSAGASVQVDVTFNIPVSYSGADPIPYQPTKSSSTADPNSTNDTPPASVPLGADTADLVVTKIGPASGDVDQDLTYQITVENLGPAIATGVRLDDTPADGAMVVAATDPCSGGFTCDLPDLAVGESLTIEATVNVPAAYTGDNPLVNTATVVADTAESFPADNTSQAFTGLGDELADISIVKGGPGTVSAGDTLTYTFLVRNDGPGTATGVILTEMAPAALVFASATSPCSGGFPCALGDLAAGAATVIGASFDLASNFSGSGPLENTASVSTSSLDPDDTNDSSMASTDVTFQADLEATKDNGLPSVSTGQMITYTIEFFNHGPADAASVSIEDLFPTELESISWTCTAMGGASCPAPSGSTDITGTLAMPAGSMLSYVAEATIEDTATGVLSNTATISATGVTDPDPDNNSATDADDIRAPVDLALTKTGPDSIRPGTNAVYTLQVTNSGPGTAFDVVLDDPTPAGLVFVSATAPCEAGFPCMLSDLATSDMTTVMVTFSVPAETLPGQVTNTATVTTSTVDMTPGNNTAEKTSTIAPESDLAIVKNLDPLPNPQNVVPGLPVTYTIVVSNPLGPNDAPGATVTDTPPAYLLDPTWSCVATGDGVCTANGSGPIADTVDLPFGATLTYTLTATVDPNWQQAVINQAMVAVPAGYLDPDSDNDLATSSAGLAPSIDLVLTKSNGVDEVVPGTDTTYVVTVENLGPSAGFGVTIADTLPTILTGATWTCTPSGGATCDAAMGSGDLDETVDIPVGGVLTFAITGTVVSSATGTISNTVTASLPANASDPNGPNSATDTDPLVKRADLQLRTVGPATVDPGNSVDYVVSLRNDGPSDAMTTITDPTPGGLTLVSIGAPCSAGFPCDVNLPSGTEIMFTVTYDVPLDYRGADPIVNFAAVSSDAIDPRPIDNKASSATPVGRSGEADVEVIKKAPEVSAIGSTVTYALTVINHGPDDARGVTLAETFPDGLSFVSATAPCETGFDCALGTIPLGARVDVEVTLAIPTGYSGPTIISNTASITSSTTDDNAANDSSTATTTLIDDPIDLVLVKRGPLAATPGGTFTTTLEVTQKGPGTATNVLLDDPTPPGLTFVSTSPECAPFFPALPCALAPIAPGETVAIDVVLEVPAGYTTPDPILNVATIDANELDADLDDNTARLYTGIDNDAVDLEVMKLGPAEVVAGEQLVYTLTVRNLGPGTATSVVLDDPTPTGTTFVSATMPCDGGFPCDLGTLLPGSSVAVTVTFDVASDVAAATMIVNTATVTTDSSDLDPSNDSASVNTTVAVEADLAITKSNNTDEIPPGADVTYAITVTNLGPSDVAGVTVDDLFPATISNVSWSCAASVGSSCLGVSAGSGDISQTVDIAVGGVVTFVASGMIDAGISGTLSNTATATPPMGVPDPDLGNNSATDTDTLVPTADFAITKVSAGEGAVLPGTVVPGNQVAYTITVTNLGPTDAIGAEVEDLFPASLSDVTWTCAASAGSTCTANGSVEILDGINLLAGGTATYSVTATIASDLTTDLVNTATVTAPDGFTDPDLSNNSATDTAPVDPRADLTIVKDDGTDTAVPGTQTTYTITVSNLGPSDVVGASVDDVFPPEITAVAWTCAPAPGASAGASCGAAGATTLNDTIDLQAGDAVLYTVVVDIDPAATGDMLNEVSVAHPDEIDPVDNTDTDVDQLTPVADLAISKDNSLTDIVPGTDVTYTITVTNLGPSNVTAATVSDVLPAGITTATWSCVPNGNASCGANGSGDLDDTVDLPLGDSVTYTLIASTDPGTTGDLVNTATVAVPDGTTDPDATNNSATDTDPFTAPETDLSISKDNGVTTSIPGTDTTYTLVVSNAGPSDAIGATVEDLFPAVIDTVSWSCAPDPGATCSGVGSGDIVDTVDIPVGGSLTYTAVASIDPAATGDLDNTATVTATGTDPDTANNSATDSDTLVPTADLSISKDDGVDIAIAGGQVTYTIVVANAGPSAVVGASVNDTFPSAITNVDWTCSATGTTCPNALGNGDIVENPDLPAGSSLTYLAVATIDDSATGDLVNTATVAAPSGVDDPVPGNNSATDVDTLISLQADLRVTKDDGVDIAAPGSQVTYRIVATNLGPDNVIGATLTDLFPAEVIAVSWDCAALGGAVCPNTVGNGDIVEIIDLPVGGSLTYDATATIDDSATGDLVNTATLAPPANVIDPNPGNNSATDTDTLGTLADVSVTVDVDDPGVVSGDPVQLTIVVRNDGPTISLALRIENLFPVGLAGITWTCTGSSVCPAPGTGDIDLTVDLDVGEELRFTADATVIAPNGTTLTNTATATPLTDDPVPGNNSDSVSIDVDTVIFLDGFESGDTSAWSSTIQ